jgi:hypothetical protein
VERNLEEVVRAINAPANWLAGRDDSLIFNGVEHSKSLFVHPEAELCCDTGFRFDATLDTEKQQHDKIFLYRNDMAPTEIHDDPIARLASRCNFGFHSSCCGNLLRQSS